MVRIPVLIDIIVVPSQRGKVIEYDNPDEFEEKCPPINGSLGQHREYYFFFLEKTRLQTNFTSTICDKITRMKLKSKLKALAFSIFSSCVVQRILCGVFTKLQICSF